MAVQRYTQTIFNRLASGLSIAADVATSFAAVQLKADPSQQFKISDVSGGYQLGTADMATFVGGYIVGYLSFNDDINSSLGFASLVPSTSFGDIFYYDQIPAMGTGLQGGTHTFQHMSRPIVINGDRVVTFILSPPAITGGGASQSVFFNLEVFGEVTQKEAQERVRLGPWSER